MPAAVGLFGGPENGGESLVRSGLEQRRNRDPTFSASAAAPAPQTKWHATWLLPTGRQAGTSWRQMSMAIGQRVWKRQPEGGLAALGISPVTVPGAWRAAPRGRVPVRRRAEPWCRGGEAARRARRVAPVGPAGRGTSPPRRRGRGERRRRCCVADETAWTYPCPTSSATYRFRVTAPAPTRPVPRPARRIPAVPAAGPALRAIRIGSALPATELMGVVGGLLRAEADFLQKFRELRERRTMPRARLRTCRGSPIAAPSVMHGLSDVTGSRNTIWARARMARKVLASESASSPCRGYRARCRWWAR